MNPVLGNAERLFDGLHGRWQRLLERRLFGTVLVTAYLAAIVVIEINRQGWLPAPLDRFVATNHFGAVDLAFTVLLIFEVLGLVWTLADSVANSVGKQFELLSLILFRKAFLEFAEFGEPIVWEDVADSLLHILSDTVAALAIFVVVGIYYRVQRHHPITTEGRDLADFVAHKKVVALLLLLAFAVIAALDVWRGLAGLPIFPFFEVFYLVLIFADILIVLISLRYSTSYRVVFRNTGFAASTVVVRLALTAPPYVNALLAVGSALFALALSVAYNAFAEVMSEREGVAAADRRGIDPKD